MVEGGDNIPQTNPFRALQVLMMMCLAVYMLWAKKSTELAELKKLIVFSLVFVIFEIRSFRYDVRKTIEDDQQHNRPR